MPLLNRKEMIVKRKSPFPLIVVVATAVCLFILDVVAGHGLMGE